MYLYDVTIHYALHLEYTHSKLFSFNVFEH